MRCFVRLTRHCFVVVGACCIGVERQVELVFPPEGKACAAECVITQFGGRVAFGQVCCVGCKAVGNNACFHVITVRQAKVLFRGNVAEHSGAKPPDHGGPNGRGNVVVARCNVGC